MDDKLSLKASFLSSVISSLIKNPADRADLKMLMVSVRLRLRSLCTGDMFRIRQIKDLDHTKMPVVETLKPNLP